MNLLKIEKELRELMQSDLLISHRYEPRMNIKGYPRHTYYKDLKSDFKEEINTFKFSPYFQGK